MTVTKCLSAVSVIDTQELVIENVIQVCLRYLCKCKSYLERKIILYWVMNPQPAGRGNKRRYCFLHEYLT